MFNVFGFGKRRAQKLHLAAMALEESGSLDDAIAKYKEAIQADPKKSESHYNIGLIYKYRNAWSDSFAYNRTAYELAPEDEAARWNLGIAATALRDWTVARQMWRDSGIALDAETGPINSDFGSTPVRLHPDGVAEVVWARRIDPVRARIENIPYPESGFRRGDIVLHDGAAVGYRVRGERKCPVFNVLELYEASPLGTFQLLMDAPSESLVETLIEAFSKAGLDAEDWTGNVQVLCKQCSEGIPHERHQSDQPAAWTPRRRLGIAAATLQDVEAVLGAWTGPLIASMELTCELPAQ